MFWRLLVWWFSDRARPTAAQVTARQHRDEPWTFEQ